MAQRLMSLDDAANQLGISKERLNELREAGKVRAYKDGPSWKFRGEDIEKFAAEGIPALDPPPSDLALDIDEEDHLDLPSSYAASKDAGHEEPPPAELSPAEARSDGDALSVTDDEEDVLSLEEDDLLSPVEPPAAAEQATKPGSDLSLDNEEMVAGPASDLSLEDVDEPTVAGLDEGSDDRISLDRDDEIDLATDSILMSEAELGSAPGRPPSTIIGKAELDLDADLDLSPPGKAGSPTSDVKLANPSDIVPIGDDELGLDLPSPSGNFEGLDELEVDLEAESSRILAPEDVAKAQAAAKSAADSKKKGPGSSKKNALSDLDLAPLDSQVGGVSDVGLGKEGSSDAPLAGLSALELDDDDDQVLGDAGSDVTLSGGSSGINIISPSDSGLALDEVPLDLSGSAPMGSSLDLGMGSSISDPGLSGIEPLAIDVGPDSKVGDFQLTPLGEDDSEDEKDSSQVIALDEISEETAGAPLGAAGLSEAGMISEDFGLGLSPGTAATPTLAPAAADTPFSIWNVLALACCVVLIGLCGMMTYDLLRNIWNFDGTTKLNSTLLQVLNPFLGR